MRLTIRVTIFADSGGYVAECEELHAVTQGDTLDETIENLREVIALALEEEDRPKTRWRLDIAGHRLPP